MHTPFRFNGIVVFRDPDHRDIPGIVSGVKAILPESVDYRDASGARLLMISGCIADPSRFHEVVTLIESVEHHLAGASRLMWGDREHVVGPEKNTQCAWASP